MAQFYLAQYVEHSLLTLFLFHTEIFQLEFDVLLHGEFIDEVERLKHKTDAPLAVCRALALFKMSHLLLAEPVFSLRGTVEQSEDIQQC